MRHAIADLSFVKQFNRYDAQYFDRKYDFLEKLDKIQSETIEDLAYISDGNHLTIAGDYLEEGGVRYLRGQDISTAMVIEDRTAVFIPEENYQKLTRSHIHEHDVLVTIVGANTGCIGFVFNPPEKLTANCKLGIVRANDRTLAPFIYSFLISRYGQAQIERSIRGGGQTGLILPDLRAIKIPSLSNNFVLLLSDIVLKAHQIREDVKTIYQKAQNSLLSELGLINWRPTHTLSYVRNYSETQNAERMDAEHFQPKFDEILNVITEVKNKPLRDVVTYTKGIEVGSDAYQDEGIPFIRVSDVSYKGIDRFEKRISPKLYESLNAKYKPQKDDLLMTKDGTIGITFVVDETIPAVLSGAFLKLHPKIPIEKEYLALVLNSLICAQQIEKIAGGALIAHLKPSDAEQILIPILSEDKQKEIAEKALKAKEARRKSRSLLDIAKQGVEKAIEVDESTAKSWMINELASC